MQNLRVEAFAQQPLPRLVQRTILLEQPLARRRLRIAAARALDLSFGFGFGETLMLRERAVREARERAFHRLHGHRHRHEWKKRWRRPAHRILYYTAGGEYLEAKQVRRAVGGLRQWRRRRSRLAFGGREHLERTLQLERQRVQLAFAAVRELLAARQEVHVLRELLHALLQ